jgi:Predicted metal-dependent hydrolase
MFIDLTTLITPEMVKDVQGNEAKALVGHLGTHFDIMDKEFPLAYLERDAVVFDVSTIRDRDIEIEDIDLNKVNNEMFVAFYTGFIEEVGYGNKVYFTKHPQLSNDLIEALIALKVSIIAIDCAGIRKGVEHTPIDQYCANNDVFVVENICNLKTLLDGNKNQEFIANTYPLKYSNMTGIPCRVVAKR